MNCCQMDCCVPVFTGIRAFKYFNNKVSDLYNGLHPDTLQLESVLMSCSESSSLGSRLYRVVSIEPENCRSSIVSNLYSFSHFQLAVLTPQKIEEQPTRPVETPPGSKCWMCESIKKSCPKGYSLKDDVCCPTGRHFPSEKPDCNSDQVLDQY